MSASQLFRFYLDQCPLVAIIRGVTPADAEAIGDAIYEGGIRIVEVPLNSPDPFYLHRLTVPASAIDANGHVNNTDYVRWMQDAAVAHSDAAGCTAATLAAGCTWVVRSHRIDYLRPAFAGDQLTVKTWVADFRRAFSRRRYEFLRALSTSSRRPYRPRPCPPHTRLFSIGAGAKRRRDRRGSQCRAG